MNKKKIYQVVAEFLSEKAQTEKYTEISDTILEKFMSLKNHNNKNDIQNRKPTAITKPTKNVSYTEHKQFSIQENISIFEPKKSIPNDWQKSTSLDQLKNTIQSCSLCRLAQTRTNFVFGEGNQNAELMFIGEGPGKDEDIQGRPFVGRAGQLLDKIITAMTYKREDVYIANIVKCRPPDNRVPEPDEAETCVPFLIRQIELIKPKVLVLLLGATPAKFLLKAKTINEIRGKWQKFMNINTMPTYHPAFLLRNPSAKKIVWEDLKLVMKELGRELPK